MKNRLLAFGLAAVVVCVPVIAFAAGLVPCGGMNADGSPEPACQACHVVELVNRIIKFLIQIGVVIAVILFAVAGIKLATSGGNASAVSSAKSIFTNVIIGFLILLASWLIIDTVMKVFAKGLRLTTDAPFGVWNEIQCTLQPTGGQATNNQNAGVFVPTQGGQLAEGQVSHADALAQLDGKVTVTSTSGASGVQANCSGSGCTSLQGLRQQTIDQVLAIDAACQNCNIVITGATEGGVHAGGEMSHGSGYKIDLDDNPTLDTFFKENLQPGGTRSGDPRYYDTCGNEYVREGNHWDITVSAGKCSL